MRFWSGVVVVVWLCAAAGSAVYLTLYRVVPAAAVDLAAPGPVTAKGAVRSLMRTRLTPQDAADGSRRKLFPANTRTVLDVPVKLNHGQYIWADNGWATGPLSIWIDVRRQMMSIFRGGDEVATAVIVYGAPAMPTPLGHFSIKSKNRSYYSRSYDADMPFSLFITDDGVALHSSPMSASHATHGCIGMPDAFARLLFEVAEPGASVTIVSSTA